MITLRVQTLCTAAAKGAKGKAAAAKGGASEATRRRQEKEKAREKRAKAEQAAARAKPAPEGPVEPGGPMQIAELPLPNTRLLASIRGRCFSMVRDYWTYEFCPMQHVRQYRQEGNKVGAEFKLGLYEKTQDKVTVGVRGKLDRNLMPHAFAQTYANGTANRRTQVRVRCSTKNEHTLLSVDEPAMHDYVMLFSSPLGCELSCAYAFASTDDDDTE